MKQLVLIIQFLVCLNAFSGDLFTDGSCWIIQMTGTQNMNAKPVIEKERLVLENGELNVYVEKSTEENSRSFMTTLKRIGNKIYFKPFKDDEKIFLMYDFGLQPGDTTRIWSIYDFNISDYHNHGKVRIPSGLKIKCMSRYEYESYGNHDIIKIVAYPDDSCRIPIGEDLWINGISSVAGLLKNKLFIKQGIGSKLQMVIKNEDIIWESHDTPDIKNTNREICKNGCSCNCTQHTKTK